MKNQNSASLTNAEFASNLTKQYIKTINLFEKKKDGQVFTPLEIAKYMTTMIELPENGFSLIDPGAGTGILLAAVCDRVCDKAKKPINIEIIAYETDKNILPYLKSSLKFCKSTMKQKGHSLTYKILPSDFIERNSQCLKRISDKHQKNVNQYDIVISNPPYQKLPRNSNLRNQLPEIIHGRTNLYSIFIALGITLLKEGGQYVFFTPRSYCSGQYHKKIRELLLHQSCIKTIHSFESRHNIFEEHDVLQEVIILHGEKTPDKNCSPINLRSTVCQSLDTIHSFTVPYHYIVPHKNPFSNLHIPQNREDLKIIDLVQSWTNTFRDLGFKISTGKVVDFRIKHNLRESSDGVPTVPLLWMQNLKDGQIKWPLPLLKKPQYLEVCPAIERKIVPVQNYVLLRRFSSKEEKKRIRAFPFLASQFSQYKTIGFENHLNYIFKENRLMTYEEVNGISALLNSQIIDTYYRTLSGNTQINSSDLNHLPVPSLNIIKKVGKMKNQMEIENFLLNKCY
jgi:adenine-specific DNA-methyltransferase